MVAQSTRVSSHNSPHGSSILDRQEDLRTRTWRPYGRFGREYGYLGHISECHSSHLGEGCEANLRYVKNNLWKNVGQLLNMAIWAHFWMPLFEQLFILDKAMRRIYDTWRIIFGIMCRTHGGGNPTRAALLGLSQLDPPRSARAPSWVVCAFPVLVWMMSFFQESGVQFPAQFLQSQFSLHSFTSPSPMTRDSEQDEDFSNVDTTTILDFEVKSRFVCRSCCHGSRTSWLLGASVGQGIQDTGATVQITLLRPPVKTPVASQLSCIDDSDESWRTCATDAGGITPVPEDLHDTNFFSVWQMQKTTWSAWFPTTDRWDWYSWDRWNFFTYSSKKKEYHVQRWIDSTSRHALGTGSDRRDWLRLCACVIQRSIKAESKSETYCWRCTSVITRKFVLTVGSHSVTMLSALCMFLTRHAQQFHLDSDHSYV